MAVVDAKMTLVKNYVVGNLIGEGSFGKVYKCRDQNTGMVYAMKVIDKTKVREETTRKHIRLEIAISKLLEHPHVVSMHHVMVSTSRIYIVQDFISGGTLKALLRKRGALPELEAKRYMSQLLDGLGYCHSLGVCHRDIKPENVFLDARNNVKIGDFGFANYLYDSEEQSRRKLYTVLGSPCYVAPEVLEAAGGRGYDGSLADIWSCGVMLYEMLVGARPFRAHTRPALFRLIRNCQYVDAGLPLRASALIRRLLCPAPDRLTMAQIAAQPWFEGSKSVVHLPHDCLEVTEAGIASAIDTIESPEGTLSPLNAGSITNTNTTSPTANTTTTNNNNTIANTTPALSPLAAGSIANTNTTSPTATPALSPPRRPGTATACCCDNVEIRHNKLIGSSTMWGGARVTVAGNTLHVVVSNRQVRAPPFPLPLTRVRAIKLRTRGPKTLLKLELRRPRNARPQGPLKFIFVFHGTSKGDRSAALRLHEKLLLYADSCDSLASRK